MSNSQKETMSFIASNFMKIVLGLCGALLTFSYLEMKSDVKTQGIDINQIKVDMATMKGDIKNLSGSK